jgi:hypothetical protein
MPLIVTEIFFSTLPGEAVSVNATIALCIAATAPPSILDEMALYYHNHTKLSFAGNVVRVTIDRSYFVGLAQDRIKQKVQDIKTNLLELFKQHQGVRCQVVIAE